MESELTQDAEIRDEAPERQNLRIMDFDDMMNETYRNVESLETFVTETQPVIGNVLTPSEKLSTDVQTTVEDVVTTDARMDIRPAVEKDDQNDVDSHEEDEVECIDLTSPGAHILTSDGGILKVSMNTKIKEMVVSIPLVRIDTAHLGQLYDHKVPLIWEGKFYRDSAMDMFKSIQALTDGDWPNKLSDVGIFRYAYTKNQKGVLFFEQTEESLHCLSKDTVSTNPTVLEYRRFENDFVSLMCAHREYILNGIIHIVMCMRMKSPVQREACIHLIWCFILNKIYNVCVRQLLGSANMRTSFTTFKAALKFNFVFPKTHDKLRRVVDNLDVFVKNIHSKFNSTKTYRYLAVPRCILTLLHMCLHQNLAVMEDNKLVNGPNVNGFISLVYNSFASNKVPIIICQDLQELPDATKHKM